MKIVWLVGQMIDGGPVWEIVGICETQEQAISFCRDNQYFIGPIEIGVQFPSETTEWPGCYYPLDEASL